MGKAAAVVVVAETLEWTVRNGGGGGGAAASMELFLLAAWRLSSYRYSTEMGSWRRWRGDPDARHRM
jgi:hypothetical protein